MTGVTREASRIAQLLAKFEINVVERTILKMYANQINLDIAAGMVQIGQGDLRLSATTDVKYMRLIAVTTAMRIVLEIVQV